VRAGCWLAKNPSLGSFTPLLQFFHYFREFLAGGGMNLFPTKETINSVLKTPDSRLSNFFEKRLALEMRRRQDGYSQSYADDI